MAARYLCFGFILHVTERLACDLGYPRQCDSNLIGVLHVLPTPLWDATDFSRL